jgi:hypothetical protein
MNTTVSTAVATSLVCQVSGEEGQVGAHHLCHVGQLLHRELL